MRSAGGQTATVLSGCAALGLRTRYVGTISSDERGQFVRAALAARGVDLNSVVVRDAPNAYALILLAPDDASAGAAPGERIVLWDRPEGVTLRPTDLPDDLTNGARLLHVDDVDEDAAIEAATRGRRAGLPVTSDIERVGDRTAELIDAVAMPIFAEHVPSQLTGDTDVERALRTLRQRHAGPLCVTLGPRGAMMLWQDRIISQTAFRVDAIDTTGAGDVFRAGFIYAVLRGDPPEHIIRFACAAAAASCTRRGAIDGVPPLAEVEAMVRGQ